VGNNITIRDLAKEAKVAIGTASRVINGHKSVSDEVRKRVQKAVKKLGYEPDRVAQSMRLRTTHTVACATRDIAIAGLGTLIHAAEDVLRDAGYILIFAGTDERKERELELLRILSQRRVDAIIIATSSEEDKELNRYLLKLDIPLVLLDRDLPAEIDAVMIDHRRGTKLATEHLLGYGHTEIALLTGFGSTRPGRQRIAGFKEAMEVAGNPNPVIQTGGFSAEFGFRETSSLLTAKNPPTAIIAGGMAMLGGVLQAIRVRGLQIPGDISVVAGADTELAALATPSVTAIRWSGVDEGRIAVQLLLSRLRGNRSGPVQRVLLSTELIKRESSGPVPVKAAVMR
jgi:LacI family transcriptional regulator, galactose operon repressor